MEPSRSEGRPSVEPQSPPPPSLRVTDPSGDLSKNHRTKYTITACARCRTRKSRCDAGLPRCHQCERSGNPCEYYDQAKQRYMPRTYIVELQNRVKALQKELADLESAHSHDPDPETLVREAAVVRFKDTDETKYLGPASGTPMTRILLQLLKKVTKNDNIKEILSEAAAQNAKSEYENEPSNPFTKDVDADYPLISQSAYPELVPQELAEVLLKVYNVKVQTMYPLMHEPTLAETFSQVYSGSTDPYKNFVVRMVMAIALQRGHTRYAGLADSFYLAAMTHFEAIVNQQNLHTLQCYVLVGQYSLLTPTRTGVFYVIGIAVRLAQALGICEEKTLQINADGSAATEYEVDMRRRLFWAVITMDFGLAHTLGRPAMLATTRSHIDVLYFKPVDDAYITPDGIMNGPLSKRKWIAIHFYRMRMLQLEIRRTLYLRKRPTPQSAQDPWFLQMKDKLLSWRDASPDDQEGQESGFNRVWFHGRYHTMIVFLHRPSPQIPRPSVESAKLCYEACEFNIEMQRKQIETKSVETTWAFTQSLFMAVNTILWTLSYAEVRQMRSREDASAHLQVALEAMRIAAVRWPGVNQAVKIYEVLVDKLLMIYEADGDIPVSAGSPFDSDLASAGTGVDRYNRSRTSSPGAQGLQFSPSNGIDDRHQLNGHLDVNPDGGRSRASSGSNYAPSPHWSVTSNHGPTLSRLSHPQFHPLPTTFADMDNWQFNTAMGRPGFGQADYMSLIEPLVHEAGQPGSISDHTNYAGDWLNDHYAQGLTQAQQAELVQHLGSSGKQDFELMIQQSNNAMFRTDA